MMKEESMSKLVNFFLLLSSLNLSLVYAKGTLAGTTIYNRAGIDYQVGGMDYNLTSNTDSFLVDKIIDLDISWQDASAVEVGASEQDRVLTFLLSNLGNGDDQFDLSYEHNSTSSFSPAPTNPRIYRDSNGNGVFDAGTDLQISDINLTADANVTLFVVSDIPDANYTSGDLSHDGITADSRSSATVGTDDQYAVDVVVRSDTDVDMGAYVIRDFWLSSQKSALVHSVDHLLHTGTIVTYSIDLSIGGNAGGRTIDQVIVTDGIPSGTVYQAGSLKLDGVSLTDVADADKGYYDGSKVTIDIGVLSSTIHQIVTFDVQVQ